MFKRALLIVLSLILSASAARAGGAAAPDSTRPWAAAPGPAGWAPSGEPPAAPAARPYARTDRLTLAVLGFGALHHLDHVLRDNHSGWPFTARVTPFTYSLAIYPIVGAAYLADAGPLAFTVIDAVGSVGLIAAHTLIEPPPDQYDPWADGSNRLGVRSPGLGRLAQAVSVGLSLSLAAHLVSSVLDGRAHGFTWKRSASGSTLRLGRAGRPVVVRAGGSMVRMTVTL